MKNGAEPRFLFWSKNKMMASRLCGPSGASLFSSHYGKGFRTMIPILEQEKDDDLKAMWAFRCFTLGFWVCFFSGFASLKCSAKPLA
ncbi:hypothetical protein CEXT_701791 [Caerostris extrusa]|uniref:Uncharacterized protein n=1 Tax=Caerostris extrusa TaxID=172846 RepID=A0AAV4Y0S8_CAEEX|nr:hypothetical protein CEXT_701791 [Caerostris extrusa]